MAKDANEAAFRAERTSLSGSWPSSWGKPPQALTSAEYLPPPVLPREPSARLMLQYCSHAPRHLDMDLRPAAGRAVAGAGRHQPLQRGDGPAALCPDGDAGAQRTAPAARGGE